MLKLLKLFEDDVEVIFIDECTWNPWRKHIKMWMNPADPFHLDLTPNKKNEKAGVAILGAISNKQREFKWAVH